MPGCKKLTVSNVENLEDGTQVAVYTCDQCDAGLEVIVNTEPQGDHDEWDLFENVKNVCRQVSSKTPIACDAQCRKRLRNCNSYTIKYDDDEPEYVEDIQCVECDEGYTPVKSLVEEPWYYMDEVHVCKRKSTDAPIPCDDLCKESFPNCEEVKVTTDPEGHSVYECTKCSTGFHPIDYEDGQKGRLSDKNSIMRQYNTIFLCTNDPNEVYVDKIDCDEGDASIFDSKACHSTINCLTLVDVNNLLTGESFYKCLKCGSGFRPKKIRNHIYDIDQSICERIPTQVRNRLFMSS